MSDSIPIPAGKANIESATGEFYPILPAHTGRYDVGKKVKRSDMTIGAGMFVSARSPVPQYLPEQWFAFTHPEGKPYFYKDGTFRTVTASYLYDRQISEKINAWIHRIQKEAAAKSMLIPGTTELFLQLDGDDCMYYFADHATRTLFWLDDYSASDLGLLEVVSESHLKTQLEEHYWTHVDHHCMHPIPFQNNIVEEMISQLIHASGDQLTSSVSTFPYSFKECKRFLEILVPARDRPVDGHVVSLVARIASVVAHNRYWTHYGQEQARLSRDSSILADAEESSTGNREWVIKACSAVTLRSSDFFITRLNAIFTDNYVYSVDWQSFMSTALGKWKAAFLQSLGLLMLHIFCFFLPISRPLAIASAGALGSSMLISALLIHQHQDLEKGSASDAYQYLSKHKSNSASSSKFAKLGFVLALPQALNLWGLLITFSQSAALLLSENQLGIAAMAVVALGSVACGLRVIFNLVSLCRRTPTSNSSEATKESEASLV